MAFSFGSGKLSLNELWELITTQPSLLAAG
jgi:hypothetical protein